MLQHDAKLLAIAKGSVGELGTTPRGDMKHPSLTIYDYFAFSQNVLCLKTF